MYKQLYDEEAPMPTESGCVSSAVSQSNFSIGSDETLVDSSQISRNYPSLPEKAHFKGADRQPSLAFEALPSLSPKHALITLPEKNGCRLYRFIRWKFFSTYRRLFTIVFLINVAFFLALIAGLDTMGTLSLTTTSSATAVNLALALVLRHEHLVNFLFLMSASLPIRAPLFLRKCFAKIYSYGGVHSGCSLAAVVWYMAFTAIVTKHIVVEPRIPPTIAGLTYAILALLLLISTFAHPALRARFHNSFEATHRFAGWSLLALFWAQVILLADVRRAGTQQRLGRALVANIPFWCSIVISLCILYPWLRLRRRRGEVQYCSNHAIIVRFDYAKLTYGSSIRISDRPLVENHAFAAIPEPEGRKGFSIVISRAGDWTKRIVSKPPSRFWVKGAPSYGVIRVSAMFSPVLIVATGSGIGPCLSFFRGCPGHPCRILWSTPSPLKTYGQGVIDGVYEADPQAIVFDTRRAGRPDLVLMAYQLFRESGSEAVIVISNQKVTRKLVYGLETRGVPAYGPIFDS